jgi:hypothetical protein
LIENEHLQRSPKKGFRECFSKVIFVRCDPKHEVLSAASRFGKKKLMLWRASVGTKGEVAGRQSPQRGYGITYTHELCGKTLEEAREDTLGGRAEEKYYRE